MFGELEGGVEEWGLDCDEAAAAASLPDEAGAIFAHEEPPATAAASSSVDTSATKVSAAPEASTSAEDGSTFWDSSSVVPATASVEMPSTSMYQHYQVSNQLIEGGVYTVGGTRVKAIEQLHILTGEVLRVYPSGKHAASFMNVSQSGISLCCSGTKPDAYGFKWRFYEGPAIDCKFSLTPLRPPYCICL